MVLLGKKFDLRYRDEVHRKKIPPMMTKLLIGAYSFQEALKKYMEEKWHEAESEMKRGIEALLLSSDDDSSIDEDEDDNEPNYNMCPSLPLLLILRSLRCLAMLKVGENDDSGTIHTLAMQDAASTLDIGRILSRGRCMRRSETGSEIDVEEDDDDVSELWYDSRSYHDRETMFPHILLALSSPVGANIPVHVQDAMDCVRATDNPATVKALYAYKEALMNSAEDQSHNEKRRELLARVRTSIIATDAHVAGCYYRIFAGLPGPATSTKKMRR